MQALKRKVAVVLFAFGDESADEKKERVFAVGAVIGSEQHWTWLEDRWNIICDGVPFHANDCDGNREDFAQFTLEQNQERYKLLTKMLAISGLGGFGIAVDLAAQRRVNPDALESLAYYKCFIELIQKMRNCAENNKDIVKFTFDMRPESEHNTGVLYAIAKNTSNWKRFIDSEISFGCSKDSARLQVADLFTREVMKAWDNKIGPVKRPMRKSWKCLRETNRFHAEVFSEEWFRGLIQNMPELEKVTGMSMSDYVRWLSATRRKVDNISNRFEYMRFVIQRDGE